jgi:uncharacterized membrane protein YhaH (DUF805 family)
MFKSVFTHKGRIRRTEFFITSLIAGLAVLIGFLLFFAPNADHLLRMQVVISVTPVLIVAAMQGSKRGQPSENVYGKVPQLTALSRFLYRVFREPIPETPVYRSTIIEIFHIEYIHMVQYVNALYDRKSVQNVNYHYYNGAARLDIRHEDDSISILDQVLTDETEIISIQDGIIKLKRPLSAYRYNSAPPPG